MRRWATSLIIGSGVGAWTVAAGAAPVTIVSDFFAGTGGWTVVDQHYPGINSPPTPLGTSAPTWSATGGNGDGYVSFVDPTANRVSYWSAPAAYLGDKSAYASGRLSFDLQNVGTQGVISQEDVVLYGNGKSLVRDLSPTPDATWRTYSVDLTEAGWHLNSLAGAAATTADLQAALASLDAIYIRGEFRLDTNDVSKLDNVILAAPEPGSWAAVAVVVALTAPRRRRRRADWIGA